MKRLEISPSNNTPHIILDVDANNKEVHNDAGTVICKKALTDDGTTYSEAEMVSGP